MTQSNLLNEIIEKEAECVLGTYPRMPFVLTHGKGMRLFDSDGKAYLDFGSGIAVNALGHAHPAVVQAVQEQVARLSHVSNLYHSEPHARLAEHLCTTSFADRVFFCNSGAEAVEAALKFARKYGRSTCEAEKTGIVAFEGGFHGRTFGALSVTPREKYQKPFLPLLDGVQVLPFNDIEAARAAIDTGVCAVIVEPVQGEGGIRAADPAFLHALRKLCDASGALLIVDEIQCGMGRTGTLWAYEQAGITPDILTSAKALGGGLPIGATLVSERVASVIEAGDHGSTFGGGPVIAAAALAVLKEVASEEMLAHIRKMSAYLGKKLAAIDSSGIGEIRRIGLMVGIEIDGEANEIMRAAAERGLLLLSAGPHVVRLLPPYILTGNDIDEAVEILEELL